MSILVNKHTKVITQGMTGATGTFHTEQALAYGTQMVGGVTPGKGGSTHIGLPMFDTVLEAKQARSAICPPSFPPSAQPTKITTKLPMYTGACMPPLVNAPMKVISHRKDMIKIEGNCS